MLFASDSAFPLRGKSTSIRYTTRSTINKATCTIINICSLALSLCDWYNLQSQQHTWYVIQSMSTLQTHPVPPDISTGAVATRICNLWTKKATRKQPEKPTRRKENSFSASIFFRKGKKEKQIETSTKESVMISNPRENCREHIRRFCQAR